MAPICAFFNNKGGVGKTTLLYHVAFVLADRGHKVLLVDCDSQCNLTAYALSDKQIEKAWDPQGNSIWRAIEPVARTLGDIRDRAPSPLTDRLQIVPGDLLLSSFEDLLGETWNSAKGGSEPALRAQSAIFRVIIASAKKAEADIVLVDLGPNLGALNRAVLGSSDLFVVPIAPDLFSIRGTENLGSKLVQWRKEWDQVNASWNQPNVLAIPQGRPRFAGFVTQQHNLRNTASGMTQGWQIFGAAVDGAVAKNIVTPLSAIRQVAAAGPSFELARIPNLHSLIPYSLEARKPVFRCGSADGLRGAHLEKATESYALFEPIAAALETYI